MNRNLNRGIATLGLGSILLFGGLTACTTGGGEAGSKAPPASSQVPPNEELAKQTTPPNPSSIPSTATSEKTANESEEDREKREQEEKAGATPTQQQAYDFAEKFAEEEPLSKAGLLHRLSQEAVSKEDADWAVEQLTCEIDYNLQANKRAKLELAKDPLDKQMLTDTLKAYEFTDDEIAYALRENGF